MDFLADGTSQVDRNVTGIIGLLVSQFLSNSCRPQCWSADPRIQFANTDLVYITAFDSYIFLVRIFHGESITLGQRQAT